MIRGVEREAEVVKVDVPFTLGIFDERDHHCLQCSVDSFDRVRLRVVWWRLIGNNRSWQIWSTTLLQNAVPLSVNKNFGVPQRVITRPLNALVMVAPFAFLKGVLYCRAENFSLFLGMNCKNTTKDIHAS